MSSNSGTVRRALGTVAVAAVAAAAGWYAGTHGGTLPTLPWSGTTRVDAQPAVDAPQPLARVMALGRLQPQDGVLRVAGPSQPSVVLAQLQVAKGDSVKSGQVLAVLDNFAIGKTAVARLQVELDNARTELQRHEKLYRTSVVSTSEREASQLKVSELEAEIQHAQAEQEQAVVRAPIAGRVLDIHARAGEKVGRDGILELADVDHMYALAQVYETDIIRVHAGQRATVSSPALVEPLQGTVERIGLKVAKLDLLDSDPVARTDARIVPVDIRLDDSSRVATLTNLQVEVAFAP